MVTEQDFAQLQSEAKEVSRLPTTRVALANQNVTDSISHQKLEQRLPCLSHKLVPSNRVKDWFVVSWCFESSQPLRVTSGL